MMEKSRLVLLCGGIVACCLSVHALNVTTDGPVQRFFNGERQVLVITNSCNVSVLGSGTLELLAIGGGGGGGINDAVNGYGGAGGGAGGLIHKTSFSPAVGTTQIVIGKGGDLSMNGGDTTIWGLTAYGGGGGASYLKRSNGLDGGSGGGASFSGSASAYGQAIYAAVDNEGHDGATSTNTWAPGGGGGAGAAAEASTTSAPGVGGAGLAFSIIGTEEWYAGGGSGYRRGDNRGGMIEGGKGGGGKGGEKGEDGKGGGGGGGNVGGCGVVIISFVPEAVPSTDDFKLEGGDDLIRLTNGTVHVFHNDGTLNVVGQGLVEVLMVGGGGGGGRTEQVSAGGGAGGVVHLTNFYVTAGSYAVTVGAGGAMATNGGNSMFAGCTAFGGGAGAYSQAGSDGASGGGGACGGSDTDYRAGGQAIYARYGNLGCSGGRGYPHIYKPGGGGGAGESGCDGTNDGPGDGGDGLPFDITGETVWYAGGGGGGEPSRGAKGGAGGGGDPHVNGTDGLGGGGGNYAAGGKGTVIVRYAKTFYKTQFEGATGGVRKHVRGGCVHTFTEDGVFTMPVEGLVEILMVGGGGGGGTNDAVNGYGGAGGGAGGLVHKASYILTAGEHQVVIGQGGELAQNGGDTRFEGMTAYGGGGGASCLNRSNGLDGGSGGGASFSGTASKYGQAIYAAADNEGHDGATSTNPWAPGGGGGAGAAAEASTTSAPGVGGVGLAFSITGTEVWYAGGGSGYRRGDNRGGMIEGGKGGGGKGGEKGEDGKGGGGGGGNVGGCGTVIIRYAVPPHGLMVIFR